MRFRKPMAFLMMALTGFWQVAPSLHAATLTWDTVAGDGGTITGGSGTWTNGLGNWNTGSGDTTWNNATPDGAVFGGTAGTVTLGGAVTVGNMVFNSGYTIADGGNVLTLSNSTITANSAATISAALSGSTGLSKDGTGTLTLSGTNSYTGVTTITAGVLSVTSLSNGGTSSGIGAATNVASNLVLNGGTLQYNNTVAGSTDRLFSVGTSGGTISVPVAGTLNLTNTGNIGFNGQTGARTVTFAFSDNPSNGGTIVLSSGITDNGGATSLLKANAYGNLRLTSNNNTYTGTTTINGGSVSIGVVGGSTGSIGSGNIVVNSGGTLVSSRSGTVNLSQTISGAGGVTLNGNTQLTLSGTNTYTGVTTILGNGGVVIVSDIENGGVASSIGASSSAAGNLSITNLSTLRYTGAGATTDRLFSVPTGTANPVGTIEASGSGALVFTNAGAMGFGGLTGARTLVLSGTNTQNNTMTPVIGDNSGATALTKSGTGRWVVAGANSYTGVTTVSGGVMSVSSLANGGSNSNLGASTNAATNVVLNGGTLQYTGAAVSTDRLFSVGTSGGTLDASGTGAVNFTNTGSMGFNSQTGTRTLTLTGTNTGSNILAAVIGDNGGATSLTKSGAGTWVLTGTNANTGTTTISGGILQVGNGGTSGALGSGAVTDNANLTFNRSDTVTIANVINGSGSVTQAGSGTTILTNSSNSYGATTISAGVLQIGNGGTSGKLGTGSVVDNGSLVVNRSDAFTISVAISGSGGFTQAGTGTTTFNTISISYTGATLISAGQLTANSGMPNLTNSAFTISSGGTLNMNGSSWNIGSLSGSGTVQGAGAVGLPVLSMGFDHSSTTFSGVIQDAGSAPLGIEKWGVGTQTLTGLNTYTGVTIVSGGVLNVTTLANGGSSSNIGASSNAATNLVLNGGTLRYTGAAGTTDHLFSVGTGGGTLDSSGTAGITFSNSGGMGFNGQTGARTLTLTGTGAFATNQIAVGIGDNGGATSLVKNGSGTWSITGTNSYTGTTTINAGTLIVGANGILGNLGTGNIINNGQLMVMRSNALTMSQSISGSGNLIQGAAGTLTLGGTNTYTGVTMIGGGGTLSISSLGNGGSASSIGAATNAAGNIEFSSVNATLKYTGAATSTDRLFSIDVGAGAVIDASGTGAINFTNAGAMGLTPGGASARSLTLTGSNTGNNTLAAAIGESGVTTSVSKTGNGTWLLTGANTYTGATTISGGKLVVSSLADGGSASNIGAASNAAGNLVLNSATLQYTGSGASTDRLFSIGTGSGTLDASGSGAVNFTNTGAMGFNGQSGTRGLSLAGTGTGSLAAAIGDNGGATIVLLTGSPTWTLSGASTYTGGTRVFGGVLIVSTLADGGLASPLGASSNAAANLWLSGGTLRYLGAAVSTDRLFTLGALNSALDASGTGAVKFTNTGSLDLNGTGARMLTLTGANTDDNTLAAGIGDNGGATILTKSGAGKWVITGANTYTGATNINAGILQVGGGGTTGTLGSGTVNNSAALVINRSDAVTIANAISGTGTFTQAGAGTTTFSTGTKSYTGATFVNAGKLQAGGANAFSTGSAITVASGAILEINGFNVVTGGLSGSGTVQNGTATGATLNIGGSASVSFDGLIQNGGSAFLSINKGGTGGTLTLTGSNTYTGGTVISVGTLSVSTLANGGVASNIGASSNAASSLLFTGGTLSYTGAAVSTDRLFSVTTNGGTLDASGTGAVNFTNTGSMGFNFQSGARNLTLTGTNTGANTIAAVIGDNGGATSLIKSGAGKWVLTGSSSYSGATTITGGVLAVSILSNGGTSSSLGAASNAASNLVINGATLQYLGGATSTDRLFSVGSSGATLDASGTGAVNFAGAGSMGFNGQTGARTLTLTGTNTGGNSIAAIISDNGGATALVKTGAGTWSLTGANTYSGSTTISGGVLSVTTLASAGSSSLGSSSNAASNLVLDGGTLQYLGTGSAITNRLFSVGTGGGTLDISAGAVNFSGSGSMGFNGQSGARTLTLTGSSTSTSNALVAVIGDNGGATSLVKQGTGYWALTGSNTYTGATTIKAGILVVSQLANGGSASGLGAASSAAANLVLDGGTLRSSAVTASTDHLFSVGLGGGTIDASSGYLNFTNTGAVGFNGQSGARTLTLSGYMRMAPSIGDSGGATSLVINALGYSVTLAGNNTYSGSTTIPSGSTLNVGEGGNTGTLGTGDVVLNGFMTFARSDTVTVANNISGTGTVLINDGINGVTIFSGSNTYTHGTAVIGGTLRVSSLANGGVASNVGASDSSAGNLQIQGATLQYVGSGASTDRLFLLGFHGGTLDASGTGALRFTNTGSLIYSLTTARTFTLSGSNTDDNTFSPVIADAGDATSVTKSGAGTWVLAGASIYTGATTITGGILRVSTLANAGSSSNVGASDNAASNLVINGGTLQYTGATATTDRLFSVGTSGGTVDASGTGAVNFTNAGSMGFNGQSGARTLTLTGTNTGSNILAAGISDNGGATSLVKAGAGTWVLTGTNTYTGTTTINAGVLQVGNGSTSGSLGSGAVINNAQLTVNRSDAVTIGNDISGSGAFTQAGTGTTTLTGSNSYTGVTTITSGVLNVTSLANGGSSSGIGASNNAASNLVINGGTLQYTGSSNVSTDRLFSVGIGSAVIDVSGSGTVNFTNTGSMGFNGESGARTLTLTGTNTSGPNIIAAAIGDFGGATSVVIDGAATWVLTGANTYTGATTLSSGVLQIGGSSLTSAIIVGANAILEIDGLNTSIGSLAGSGTVRNNAGTAATLTMGGNDLSTTFSGVIKDGGAGALYLVKTGAGTFTLTGANTYSGTTTISSGVLQVGSGGTTGTLGSGAVTNNAQLTINRSNAIALDNDISGSGSLTQAGSGTSTLSGNSSYTGSTAINAGVLSVGTLANGGDSSNIGASSNAASNLVLNGGTLQYTGGNVSADRLFSVGTNGGTLDASGTGAVNFTNTGSMGFNGQSGIRTLTLTGTNSSGNTLAAVIGDNGGATSLTKSGTGTWVLTGANTYTGNTTVNAGTLQIGDGGTTGSLSTSSALNIDGTLAFNRSDTVKQGAEFANVISGSGGVTQAGGGTLTLNGSNTYAGATNVRSGTLEVTSNNALGTNAAGTQVSSGGTLLLNNVNYSTAEDLTLNGSGAGNGGALRNSGTSTYTGQITAATDASINAGGGILNLTGGLVKDGTVLTITGGGTVYVSGTGISGASANSDLVVDGTTLVVSADSDYNGPTTVKNGAVLVANAAVATTQFDLSSDSTLAGTGSITTAMNESIFINGAMSVGDPAIIPTATSFALSTSGTGTVVLGAGSLIHLDLFTGAGAGNNLANASAADSINLHGKIDATAGGTLVIGNPNGMTGFRGGDQWQLFNLNSGSANAGSFVSNLALNDSSLRLASGVTSYLDQSTGVFSIIDTNGGLATAAAEGQALIGGGNTVTADLNGHLFNLRAGGGEEEDAGSGSIAAALYEEVIVGEGDGDSEKKESPIVKSVPRSRQWEVFATVNYGNVKLSPIRTQSGVQVDSWASGAGIERHFTRGLTLGFAVSFLQSTQGFTGNLGSLYMEGPALSSYASYVRGAFWNSLLYSFGTYQMDSVRNPGAPFPTANGSTRAYTHSVQYNTGWNFRFQNKTLVTGPFAGVDYLHGTVDAYSETGGGLAALHYGAQSFQSLVSRVGWSASKKFETRFGMITPQVRLSYERQNIKNNNGTNVSLINVPFSSFAGNQNPGQDYLVAGMGVSIAFSERFSLMLSYQGQFFRHDLQAHFGSVRFSYQF